MRSLLILLIASLVTWPAVTGAQEVWEIEQFNSAIAIEADGSIVVNETISVDFAALEKHGIFRDIPVTYQKKSGGNVYSKVSNITVLQDGKPAQVETTHTTANMRLRIGDPDKTISGRHEYLISYRVLGVLQSFEGFDELNWNVTGHQWEAPITKVTSSVKVPASILQASCYEGVLGATAPCEEAATEADIVRFTAGPLLPGEGLTVAVGYTPGVIPVVVVPAPATFADVMLSRLALGMSIIVFLAGIAWIMNRWWRYGRDRHWQRAHLPGERSDRDGKSVPEKIVPLFFKQSVSVEYDPPDGLRPAEMGMLIDERADTLDISATIVDLAARDYLTITEIPKTWVFGKKDYQFTRTEKTADDLLKYERELVKRLFDGKKDVKLSDLKNTFYKDLAKVKEFLDEEVAHKGLFAAAPHKVRQVAAAKSMGVIALGVLALGVTYRWLIQVEAIHIGQQLVAGGGMGVIGMGIISLLFSWQMPRKTGYGRELYERVLGYQLFVSGTEKYRAKFYENEGLFVAVLPYAIMFGVADKLAQAFKEMGIEPPQPTWFHSAATFNAVHFASSMSSFSSSLSSAMASSPSSSGSGGGGSSGGGFGGGGGGSW